MNATIQKIITSAIVVRSKPRSILLPVSLLISLLVAIWSTQLYAEPPDTSVDCVDTMGLTDQGLIANDSSQNMQVVICGNNGQSLDSGYSAPSTHWDVEGVWSRNGRDFRPYKIGRAWQGIPPNIQPTIRVYDSDELPYGYVYLTGSTACDGDGCGWKTDGYGEWKRKADPTYVLLRKSVSHCNIFFLDCTVQPDDPIPILVLYGETYLQNPILDATSESTVFPATPSEIKSIYINSDYHAILYKDTTSTSPWICVQGFSSDLSAYQYSDGTTIASSIRVVEVKSGQCSINPVTDTPTPTPSRTPDMSPKVVLYAQVNYAGDALPLGLGTHNVPNRLYYSMFVPNGMSVTLFSTDNRSRCFATSQHNLQDHEEWYRDIDRVQVHDHNACPATATPTPNNSGVVRLFAKANYEEEVLRLGQGSNPIEARNYFSIDMPDGWSVRLYTESGDNRCFEQDVPNLQDHEEWWRLTRRVDVMAYNGCGTASGKIRLYRVANYGDQFMELGVGTHTIAYNTQIFSMRVDSGMSAYFHAQDGRNRCWNENVSNMQDHESYWYDTVRIDVYGHDACPKPTATPTPSFTLTATPPPTPTDTPQPPTATPTKTRTSVPSPIETPTRRPTNTPTKTPTKTPTPTRTPTPTPRKLYLPLSLKSVPTITQTPTATSTSTPKPIDNTEWIVYEKWLPNSEGTEWGGEIELWIVKSDGSELRPLVTGGYRNENPRWSPDGQKIVFDQVQVGVRKWRIMTIESDGSNLTTVAEFLSTSLYPSWLNDTEILFSSYRSSGWQLFKVAVGTGQTTPLDVGVPNIFSPSASPSTGHFAFHGNDGVYVSSPDTASVWPLMNGSAIVQGYPLNWHPDGQYVMVGDHPACHKIQIFDMTAEAIDGFPECNLSWSPTGDRIAYQSVRGPGGGIWIVDSDGSNRKELVPNSDNAFIRNPQWKPQ